jgi:hypothetical protein
MKMKVFVCAVALMALGGCGGDSESVCQKAANYAKKCGDTVTAADIKECEDEIGALSSSCKSAFSAVISCSTKLSCDAEDDELAERCGDQALKVLEECEDLDLGE